jgi:hypothetical protein
MNDGFPGSLGERGSCSWLSSVNGRVVFTYILTGLVKKISW